MGLAAYGAPLFAADVGVSISVGEPGFYGRIDIGDYPRPRVYYSEPMYIEHGARYREPVYLLVRPGHARNWKKYCREYGACGERTTTGTATFTFRTIGSVAVAATVATRTGRVGPMDAATTGTGTGKVDSTVVVIADNRTTGTNAMVASQVATTTGRVSVTITKTACAATAKEPLKYSPVPAAHGRAAKISSCKLLIL